MSHAESHWVKRIYLSKHWEKVIIKREKFGILSGEDTDSVIHCKNQDMVCVRGRLRDKTEEPWARKGLEGLS